MSVLRALVSVLGISAAVADSDTLKTCLKDTLTDSGRVAFKGDVFDHATAVNPYNLNLPVTPAVVTFPASTGRRGTLLGDVMNRLHDAGGRAMSHGTCPQVGSGGHFIIGGLGPTSPSAKKHPDVFWAIKGAASGFGIVTEFKVRTEPEPGTAVQYAYTLKVGSTKARAQLFKQWQDYVSNPKLTRKLASTLTLLEGSMAITGTFYGAKKEYDALKIDQQFLGANGSAVVSRDWLGSSGTLAWFLLFDFQGYTNDIATDATSYAYRDVSIWLQPYSINLLGPVTKTQTKFLDQVNKLVTNDKAPYAAYPEYVDPRMSHGQQAYWGSNLRRLEQIKAEIDPKNVFRNP
ncbi:hypothetical protein NUU61_008464 [Penicillium alfredii]|uniref:Berberine/berberine-like domain-containing protein n=1 Tax=Penicillium alfredii TaxID=1506179 RepID=A0A9W9ELG4_9EURO|nr:uncharacterized protein NUU61_008464 [Penicillium alfredii]KAJ5083885.1 hypothetical protein NUU61_008464 [Penicillium alfredii]